MKHKVYVSEGGPREMSLGRMARVIVEGGTLTIIYRGRPVLSINVKPGEVYNVSSEGGGIYNIQRRIPPKGRGALVAWLMGYTQHRFAQSKDGYRKMCKEYHEKYQSGKSSVWEEKGANYCFMKHSHNHACYSVAAWVSDEITTQEILKLIHQMVYPHEFLQKILKERFDVSNADFERAQLNRR